MAKPQLRAGTSPFAHLLAVTGLGRAKKAEEETPVDEEGPSDEDEREETEEEVEDVEETGGSGKKGKAKKAKAGAKDDDNDDQDAEADATDDDVDAEEGEDEEKAAAFRAGMALGRERENARCARIFRSKAAAGRPDLAATLAFTTRNTSAEADRLLSAAGSVAPSRAPTLAERMSGRTEARPGADTSGGGKPSFNDRIAAAKKKAGIA